VVARAQCSHKGLYAGKQYLKLLYGSHAHVRHLASAAVQGYLL
jgi:hypothetical protein